MTDHPTFRATCPTRIWKLRHHRQLAMAFVLGMLGGSLATTGKAAASCVGGDVVDLTDPVVTVISGPGDPVAEQAMWMTFVRIILIGPDEFHVGSTMVNLEESL